MNEQEILIFKYLDGECNDSELAQVRALLKNNSAFVKMFNELKTANDVLNNTELEQVPKGFANNVMKRIQPAPQLNLNSSFVLKFLAGLIGLVLLVDGLLQAFQIDLQFSVLDDLFKSKTVIFTVLVLFFFSLIEVYLIKKDQKQRAEMT